MHPAIGTTGADLEPQVFVLDDDRAVLLAIQRLLCSAGFAVATLESADDLLCRLPVQAPACLVLDVRLPGTSGLELQRHLAERDPSLPIVFITGYGNIPMSVRAIKAGAVEFLAKPFTDEELLSSVRQALDQARRHWGVRQQQQLLEQNYEQLTPRERQVLDLVVSGLANKEVALELSIAEATVKIHRSHIMQKMRAGSFAELVRMAERIGPRSRRTESDL